MADFDPFAAAGLTPPPTQGYSPVIDVAPSGGEPNINPNAAPGTPGSGLIPSQVGGADTGNVAPPPVPPGTPVMRVTPGATPGTAPPTPTVSDTVNQMLTETAPGQETPAPAPAPSDNKKPAAFDPFAAAGLTSPAEAAPPPAAAAPAAAAAASPAAPAWQPIKDAIHSVVQSLTTVPPEGSGPLGTPPARGATASLQHGFTVGLDDILAPLIPAAAESLATGKPFSQVYDDVMKQMRDPRAAFEKEHPYAAAALSTAGGLASPVNKLASPLFSGAPAVSTVGKVVNAARNVTAGAGVGAGGGFLMTDGDVNQRLEGAKEGAQFGAGLSAAQPVIGAAVRNVVRGFRPSAAVDPITGQALRESAGLQPGDAVPVPAASPLPGVPVGTAAAFNNPGLAARERNINSLDDAGRQAQIAAQTTGVRQAATTIQPSGVRLATATTAPDASNAVVNGVQRARGIVRDEEQRLWTKPSLMAVRNDVNAIRSKVGQAIARMPQRFQSAIARSPDIQAVLDDLRALPPDASLHDVNQLRSDLLKASRALPRDQRFAKLAVDDVARAMLDGIESNPGLRNNPVALADYQRARAFTNRLHDVFGTRAFSRMIEATEGNAKGLDAGTMAGQLFNFGKGTEINPQSVARVTDLLDDVRRQWGALAAGNAGVPLPGLSPAAAFAARAELAQGTRDYIVHTMLDAAASNVRDQSGNQRFLMNKLSDWIDTNRPWIARSRMFTPSQMEIMDRIRDFSIMAQAAENLRGGTNSATYEKFAGDRYVDAFIGPFLGRAVGKAGGALAGLVATHLFGEGAIGSMIGLELAGGLAGGAGAGHVGAGLLQKYFAGPRAEVMAKMMEAIRDPVIAEDLMKKAGAKVSPQTMAWAKSLLASVPAEQAARTVGEPVQ